MIFVTGAGGQLGLHVQEQLLKKGYKYIPIKRSELDISNESEVENFFTGKNVTLLINTAAYTNVDKAEKSTQDAYLVNEGGIRNLSKICNFFDAPIIHISTDYVFNGFSRKPYKPEDITDPMSVYGHSKLAGERALIENAKKFFLIRTSWVFSEYGKNFFKTILKLAQTNEDLKIVSDQFGNPTYAGDLAKAIVSAIPNIFLDQNINEVYHYAGDEVCTWYEFAREICKEALSHNIISKMPNIIPVSTAEFVTPARRPKYSSLDSSSFCKNFNLLNSNWRQAIKNILQYSSLKALS